MNRRLFYYAFIFFLLLVDQVTKFIVAQKIALSQSVHVIPGFFSLFGHFKLSTQIHNVIHKEPMHFSLYFDGYAEKKISRKRFSKGV